MITSSYEYLQIIKAIWENKYSNAYFYKLIKSGYKKEARIESIAESAAELSEGARSRRAHGLDNLRPVSRLATNYFANTTLWKRSPSSRITMQVIK
jgi:hypothetical protein